MPKPEVLVVDDDTNAIRLIDQILGAECSVRFARSGEDALAQIEHGAPELVLLDMEMPGLGGLEVCQRLQADARTAATPVIFVTRHGDEASEVAALDAGAVDFISKPLTAPKVLARVRSQLNRRRSIDHILHASAELPLLPDVGRRPRVLVVDDDALARGVIHVALATTDAKVCFADGGDQALDAIVATPPDLVMLDLLMPGIDGWQVLSVLQSSPRLRHVPVVVITRVADQASEARALAAGATDFLAKPFSPAVLQARMRNALRLRRQVLDALTMDRTHWRRLSDARLADVVAAATDAILTVDDAGRVRLANHAAEAWWPRLHVQADESVRSRPPTTPDLPGTPGNGGAAGLEGLHLSLLWPELPLRLVHSSPGPQTHVRSRLPAQSSAAGTAVEVSWSILDKDGERLTTLFIRDVSERERAEAALRVQARLQATSQIKAQMIRRVAQEVGDPLNGIVGLSSLMLGSRGDGLTEAHRNRLQMIDTCARQALALMHDVLDLHRIEASQFDVHLQPVLVTQALDGAVAAVARQAERARVALNRRDESALLAVQADPVRLQQVLVRLLGNAIKYSAAGDNVAIQVAQRAGEPVCISVTDSGLGMTAEQLAHLRDPGLRPGAEKSAAPGTGIGLLVAGMLLEAMGGNLQVRSEPRVGSVFSVLLLENPADDPAPACSDRRR